MLAGGGCKHARKNIKKKNMKIIKNYTESGVSSLNWGVFTPPPRRGVSNITDTKR